MKALVAIRSTGSSMRLRLAGCLLRWPSSWKLQTLRVEPDFRNSESRSIPRLLRKSQHRSQSQDSRRRSAGNILRRHHQRTDGIQFTKKRLIHSEYKVVLSFCLKLP